MLQLYEEGAHERDFFIENCLWKGSKCDVDNFHETITDLGVCHTFDADDMNVESSGGRLAYGSVISRIEVRCMWPCPETINYVNNVIQHLRIAIGMILETVNVGSIILSCLVLDMFVFAKLMPTTQARTFTWSPGAC